MKGREPTHMESHKKKPNKTRPKRRTRQWWEDIVEKDLNELLRKTEKNSEASMNLNNLDEVKKKCLK